MTKQPTPPPTPGHPAYRGPDEGHPMLPSPPPRRGIYALSDITFRALLDLFMVSDPWPAGVDQKPINDLLEGESIERGYNGWVEAYHKFKP